MAKSGAGNVAPNPMVGAVLVHEDKIIGEGFHKNYGGPHAEVNCLASIKEDDKNKIADAILYVSLEPCSHYGKTPPCTDLIIKNRIMQVVIGCRDPFPKVNGRGIEKLGAAGVNVISGILEKNCVELNKRFFVFHTKHRPYIILKWAESNDGKIGFSSGDRLLISGEQTNRLTHKWRGEEASILVGTNTAMLDDPALTTRFWNGKSPVRIVIDKELRLPGNLRLFDQQQKTIVFNLLKHEELDNLVYYQLAEDSSIVQQIITALYQFNIQSVLVEGGAKLLQSFIDEGLWDEVRIIRNKKLTAGTGIAAPEFSSISSVDEMMIGNDSIRFFENKSEAI